MVAGLQVENSNRPVVQVWGDFSNRSRWQDIPSSIRHEAKRSMLNIVGTALGAANQPAVETAVNVLLPFAGAPHATIIGRAERFDILNASFVNAVSANLFEFDDTHLRTVIHPSAPVGPPLFALAEQRGISGAQVLHAFVIGVEIECRLGNSVSPEHYARGWHITASCGVFGSAAASAKLLGLDPSQTAHAIGIAASASSGIIENLTTGAKNVGVGNAARNGLFAAFMAERGYIAAPLAVEGPHGWVRVTGGEPDTATLTEGLGESWELSNNAYKPYPCGIVLHSVIDGCLELRTKHKIAASDVESVTVMGHPLLLARGDRAVANERDAKVSIHHSVAVSLLFGSAGVREFSSEIVRAPAVVAFRAKVRAEVDNKLPVGAARVSVRTTGGDLFTIKIEHARGSLKLPMSDADIENKVKDSAAFGESGCNAERVIDAVWNLEKAGDLRTLMDSVTPS
jgi:2-methylcitrate dehydratase PrpD